MSILIGIGDKERADVIKILNRILADEVVLLVKTKNYHWNVVGPDFSELHKFFDSQYEKLTEFVDSVAERTRSLGSNAIGSMTEFLESATLKEASGDYPKSDAMIQNLLKDHEHLIRNLRKDSDDCDAKYHDMGTNDFLVGLMEEHEKMAWMLRSYLEG